MIQVDSIDMCIGSKYGKYSGTVNMANKPHGSGEWISNIGWKCLSGTWDNGYFLKEAVA